MLKYKLCFAFLFLNLLFIPDLLFAQFLGQQSLSQSSYVIDQSGVLWSWGWNFDGQLGVGDRVNRDTPCVVQLPEGAKQWTCVAGGANFAVAIADTDKLYAWGLNDKGQIGQGYVGGNIVAGPMRIQNPPTVTGWKWVSAGAAHCEALTNDGRLFAWGDNSQGELGPGNTKYLPQPELVEYPTDVKSWAAVAAGPGYTMMLSQAGKLYACGKDSLLQFTPWEGPVLARIDTFRAYSPLPCIAASNRLELRIDQQYLLDYNIFYVGPTGGSPDDLISVAAGGQHSMFLDFWGDVITAGDNTYGQLGVGAGTNIETGVIRFPTGVTQFVAIAGGAKHSLAIGNDGWLYAWGDDSLGELGIGSTTNKSTPVKVLRVCPALSMSGSMTVLNNPSDPYSVTLSVKNSNSTNSLNSANAFLVLPSPLLYRDSTPDEQLPSPILPKATSTATWDGTIDHIYFDSINVSYCAYVLALGSSPLLVPVTPMSGIKAPPWRECDPAQVVDSLTGVPLAGADAVFPGPPPGMIWFGIGFDSNKMVSDSQGYISLCFKGPVYDLLGMVHDYPVNVMKENYSTTRYGFAEPIPTSVVITLGPSNIQGIFSLPAPAFEGDSLLKVYYPDSMIGYAISRRQIFRTMDSGISWTAIYAATSDLHDIKFFDIGRGWVVGDNGTILSTTDTGNTWQENSSVTSQNLRAIFIVDEDTAWAVGDSGTVLKKSAATWTLEPSLSKHNLTCIHFLDPEDGVIGALNGYYIYKNGKWTGSNANINAMSAYQISPHEIFFGGKNGTIVHYNDTSYIGLLTFDSTYTHQNINNIYFLNTTIGYAVGDSGESFVTYDNGTSWPQITDLPYTSTSVNFFSLAGHAVTDNAVLNYTGMPNHVSGIVRGRVTYGNPAKPILGARVDRIFAIDSFTNLMESAYSNEQGNFVFTGLDTFFHYRYQINFEDSGIQKVHTFDNVKVSPHEIITLNYNDYAPPQTDTILSVGAEPAVNASLEIVPVPDGLRVNYFVQNGPARLLLQDILGRTIREDELTAEETSSVIPFDNLPTGTYYVTLATATGSITKRFSVVR